MNGVYRISGIGALRLDAIPGKLKVLDQWVAGKAEPVEGHKPRKLPINSMTGGNAMSNNPSTWGSFAQAVRRATSDNLAGIGIMFAGDDLVGVDMDDVIEDGQFTNPLAEAFVRS